MERGGPVRVVEQADVVVEADPARQVRQDLGAGEGENAREDDETVDEQQDQEAREPPTYGAPKDHGWLYWFMDVTWGKVPFWWLLVPDRGLMSSALFV